MLFRSDVAQDQKEDKDEKNQVDVEEGEEKIGIEPQQSQLDPGQDDDEEYAHKGKSDFPLPLATFMGGALLDRN